MTSQAAEGGDSATQVDLLVNCWEGTYRSVLAAGFMGRIVASQCCESLVTVLINNVDSRSDANRRASELVASGEISRFAFVEDLIDDSLRVVGLTRRRLGRAIHFIDWALATVTMPGPEWVAHWDAEVTLQQPCDWITPSIKLLDNDSSLLVANPAWWLNGAHAQLEQETLRTTCDFAIGRGFSDQVYLVRRADLAAPVYRKVAPASWRYPIMAAGPTFEARVDAHMRRSGLLRATYLPAVYEHPIEQGISHVRPQTPREWTRELGRRGLTPILEHLPVRHPALQIRP